MQTEPAIEVHGLRKAFRDQLALDDVSFEVAPGTVFGLLGPNGAGKTTIVRILTTLLQPDAGSARLLGIDVHRHPAAVRRRIGLAGQYATVDPNLTGRENLRLIGRLSRLPRAVFRARADDLLDRFDLADAANRPVRGYSGGMRRRLDVAAALVSRPAVLFLDEPTTGLDLSSRNGLWGMIRELVTSGTTVVLTTQYLEEADQLADRVAVIDHGRVVADDTPAALKARLGSTVVEFELADGERAAAAQRAAAGLDGGVAVERTDRTVRVRSNDGSRLLLQLVRVLDDAGLPPVSLRVRTPTLDDVFLDLTADGRAATTREPAVAR